MTTPSGHRDLLNGPAPTLLAPDDGPTAALAGGTAAADVAARYPATSAPWAALADEAWAAGHVIESYAYARVGYHRGLDALRRSGWKGFGPVPWSHEPNQGFLRALAALARAAKAIDEEPEFERCAALLEESDPAAVRLLLG